MSTVNEDTETQEVEVIYPRSHNSAAGKQDMQPDLVGSFSRMSNLGVLCTPLLSPLGAAVGPEHPYPPCPQLLAPLQAPLITEPEISLPWEPGVNASISALSSFPKH